MDKKTILVVDDDPGILEVITIILSEKGYKVISLSDGHKVFSEVKKKKPDMMFLDIWISGTDGREITKKLKEDNETKDIPIVIVSALNETGKIAKEIGANAFLEKPFDIERLLQIVKNTI